LGPVNKDTPYLPLIEEIDYLDFFSRCRIELAYTGQLSLNERRQNYMQAVQLLGSMLQILMQMGSVYRLEPIIDRLLKDFGVDLREVKEQQSMQQPMPQQSPTDMMPALTSAAPSGGVPLDLAMQLLNTGGITPEEVAPMLAPEALAALETLPSDTLY